MAKQSNILEKYDLAKLKNESKSFITIPRKIVSLKIPENEKGMFIQLLSMAGIAPGLSYHYVLTNQSVDSLVNAIFWKKGNKRIAYSHTQQLKSLLDQLQTDKLIKISRRDNGYFDIILPTVHKLREGDDGFIKLYFGSLSKIKTQLVGMQRLKTLFFYATIRSKVYENNQQQEVITDSPNYFAKLANISAASSKKHFEWLRNNGVLAYYKCEQRKLAGYIKYFYADMHDADILTKVVKGYIEQDVIKKVLE